MLYVCNAFSGNMVPENCVISKTKMELENLRALLARLKPDEEIISAVGHADTANVFSDILGFPIAHNRINVTLSETDGVLVGQISTGRLPEGCTTLPEGVKINWFIYSWYDHDKLRF